MITYAIIKKLSDDVQGFTLDESLFWEELPLQKNGEPIALGTWAVTRGGSTTSTTKGLNQKTTIDFYVTDANKAKTEAKAAEIAEWLRKNVNICELKGSLAGVNYGFENVRIWQTATPQNQGTTPNGAIVKMLSADVVFDIIK